MRRIAGADVDEDLFGAGKDGFQEGDPGVSGATVVTEDFLNDVQETLLHPIEAAGLTPDGTSGQLTAAIAAMAWVFTGDVQFKTIRIVNTTSIVSFQLAHSDLNTASAYIQAGSGASTVAALLVDGGLDILPGSISNPKGLRQRAQAPIALRDTESYRYCDSAGALTSPTRSGVMIPLAPMRAHADWTTNGGGDNDYLIVAAASGQQILFDVRLPNGAVVSEVRAGVRRGAGGSGDINLNVYSVAHDTGAAPGASVASLLGNDATSGTSAVADRLAVSGLSFTQGASNMLRVEINASSSGAEDRLYWLSVTFSDPGPRNY